ncbi:MAG TPA: amidase [Hyphomicrobiaceae bacterium]|nr:amidase [Hyphomicrobiaceae bacterium]
MAKQSFIDLSATEASALLSRGEVSAVEYVTACLERIAEREEEVRAFEHLDAEHALRQAKAADEARAIGLGVGPLNGLPVGLKDIIETADMPTGNGSPIFKGYQPTRDAVCVSQLKTAGAVIMGKTVTTELATLVPGKTRNPHNLAHTPGGSSSGSAAAVADRMIPLALGTQTGGSVIRPASFCGIFGLKPTLGLISRRGVTMQSHTLDTVGVYGRSVEDLGLVADALSAHDPDDEVSYPRARPSLAATLAEDPPVPPLLAFCKTHVWDQAEAATKDAFAELVATLGNRVQEVDIPALELARKAQPVVQGTENAAYYGPLLDKYPEGVAPALADRIRAGRKFSGEEYVRALRDRETIYAAVERTLVDFTAILTPASCGPAPKGLKSTGNPVFNATWTLLGVPCVTLPLLDVDGLPLGVQLVGRRRDDGRLLRTARWLARELAPKPRKRKSKA